MRKLNQNPLIDGQLVDLSIEMNDKLCCCQATNQKQATIKLNWKT